MEKKRQGERHTVIVQCKSHSAIDKYLTKFNTHCFAFKKPCFAFQNRAFCIVKAIVEKYPTNALVFLRCSYGFPASYF